MKFIKKCLILIVIVFTITFSYFSSFTIAQSDINYRFNRNIAIDYNDTTLPAQSFNLRNMTSFIEGFYNASYSWTDDAVGEGNPAGWITTETGSSDVRILANKTESLKVVELEDGASGLAQIVNNPTIEPTFGTMEFWFRTNDTNLRTTIQLQNNGNSVLTLRVIGNRFEYFDVSFLDLTYALDDTWYHIRVDFECTGGSYKGLGQYEYDVYINGTIKANDVSFQNNENEVDTFLFGTISASNNYNTWLDAIGFTWEGYQIGTNLMPVSVENPLIQEVDRWEFAFESPNEFYDGVDTINGWTRTEVSDGLVVFIDGLDPTFDRELSISVQDGGDTAGITRDNMATTTGSRWIRVAFDVIVGAESGNPVGANMAFNVNLYSDDNTQITGIRIAEFGGGSLELDRWANGFSELRNDLSEFDILQFDLFINHDLDMATLEYSVNDTFIESFSYNLATTGKIGLKKVECLLTTANPSFVDLDNIGIYSDSNGFITEFGYITINMSSGINDFSTQVYNLINFKGNGFIEIGVANTTDISGNIYIPESPYGIIIPFQFTTNVSTFFNSYDTDTFSVDNPIIVIFFAINNLTLTEFDIEGVKLNEGSNEYPLIFDHENISIQESFFFVDSINRLRFTHIANDTNTEFIEATFNINDFSSNDTAVSFQSQINSNALGFFRVKFATISNFIPLSLLSGTQRLVLSQNETVQEFRVIITDNDDDTVSGLTSGFVSIITIFFPADISNTVTTLSLLQMLIPLIIILIPTIALRELYGKSFVIPIFLLMSFILTIGGIIPVWLTFVIMISVSSFIIKPNDRGL